MNGKQIVEALHSGKRIYGTHIVSDSPRWPMDIHKAGLDFVFIDTEHIPIDRGKLSWMCHAYRNQNLAPIVRIPSPDPYEAAMVLDGGACGIIAPYVETVEQVIALRGAVKMRPVKGRMLQNALNGTAPFGDELQGYIDKHNEENILIINIESIPALEALDDLLMVPGLDAVLIGPHDLSCNLGIPEQYSNPIFDNAVKTVISKARARGIGAGIHFWADMEQEIEWAKAGANLIIHSADLLAFIKGMKSDINYIKAQVGDEADKTQAGAINI